MQPSYKVAITHGKFAGQTATYFGHTGWPVEERPHAVKLADGQIVQLADGEFKETFASKAWRFAPPLLSVLAMLAGVALLLPKRR